jgi:hypothetical protein
MQNPTPRPLLERNPVTQRRHRHEVFWQITIPLLAGVLVLVGIILLAAGTDDLLFLGQEANVASIWLMAWTILILIIFFPLLILITYLVIRLIGVMPHFFKRGQDIGCQIQAFVSRTNDRLVQPILGINEKTAAVRALKNKLVGKKPNFD